MASNVLENQAQFNIQADLALSVIRQSDDGQLPALNFPEWSLDDYPYKSQDILFDPFADEFFFLN